MLPARTIAIASALLLALPAAAAAAPLTIDDFALAQEVLDVPSNPPPFAFSERSGQGVFGGSRDLEAVNMPLDADATRLRAADGRLVFTNIPTSRGAGFVTWDGADDSAAIQTRGLGGIDLTAHGGVDAAFVIDVVRADAGLRLTVDIYDMASGKSSIALTLATALEPGKLAFHLRDFSGDADFADVGAIQLRLLAKVDGVNAEFGRVQVTAAPVPATLPLLGGAVAAFAAFARRKRRRGAAD